MLACMDVDYREGEAFGACILFREWTDAAAVKVVTDRLAEVAPYEPGKLYLRELPCLLRLLEKVREPIEVAIVDGYVWLGREGEPGLGGHLYRALGGKVAVVGVAKSAFRRCRCAREVIRGRSRRPLHVTAAGMAVGEASRHIREMAGMHRIPRLLKEADRVCRAGAGLGRIAKLYH